MRQPIHCWCGSNQFDEFSEHYGKCKVCGSLVCQTYHADLDSLKVKNDDTDFYGREYWLSHQTQDYNHPDIYQRARQDLPERALYWLKTLLKYKIPPGKALELGSAHGGFVGMMEWAGFEAIGLEMSPWVVNFAQTTFNIPMVCGPIEDQQFEKNTFDIIALMDILEHLSDPEVTMRYCVELLKPDGLLIIQTPCYRGNKSYGELLETNNSFLLQLKETEHFNLFTENSIKLLFERLELPYICFEPAIFEYDMFFITSRVPLSEYNPAEIVTSLSATPSGRLVQALLDLDDQFRDFKKHYAGSEADRAARLEQINQLTQLLQESEADRAARLEVINQLGEQLQISEADRAARLEVIQAQEQTIHAQEQTIQVQEQILNRRPAKLLRRLKII